MNHRAIAALIQREQEEKQLIRDYFDNERGLVVVEVGANVPTGITSQSYHLEKELGWKAVLVE